MVHPLSIAPEGYMYCKFDEAYVPIGSYHGSLDFLSGDGFLRLLPDEAITVTLSDIPEIVANLCLRYRQALAVKYPELARMGIVTEDDMTYMNLHTFTGRDHAIITKNMVGTVPSNFVVRKDIESDAYVHQIASPPEENYPYRSWVQSFGRTVFVPRSILPVMRQNLPLLFRLFLAIDHPALAGGLFGVGELNNLTLADRYLADKIRSVKRQDVPICYSFYSSYG